MSKTPRPSHRRGLIAALLLLLAVAGLNCPGAAHAQTPDLARLGVEAAFVREQWTARDGLPVNAVNDVAQTPDGYLWVATYDGLARFDGVRFTVYRSGAYPGLPSSRLTTVTGGAGGVLWLSTEQHDLVRFDGRAFAHADSLRGRGGLEVHAVARAPGGQLWFGTDRGVVRAGAPGEPVVVQPAAVRGVTAHVLALAWGARGQLWLGTRARGLLRVEPDGTVARVGPPQEVGAVHVDAVGRVWAGTAAGAARVTASGTLAPVRVAAGAPRAGAVFTITSGAQGRVWLGTERGVYVTEDSRRAGEAGRGAAAALLPAVADAATRGSTGPKPVYARDAEGRAWVRTARHVYRDGVRVFETRASVTRVLHDREGNTWVGTATGGLHRLRPAPVQVVGPPEGLPTEAVYPVLHARDGSVWLGGLGGAVTHLDGARARTYRPGAPGAERFSFVWTLAEGRRGTLWAGGPGLARLDPAGRVAAGRVAAATPAAARWRTDGLPAGLRAGEAQTATVRAVHEDAAGRLWVGTQTGLWRRRTGCTGAAQATCWRRFTTADGLPHDWVRVIHERPNGRLWMGTNGGGLVRVTPAAEDASPDTLRAPTFEALTTAQGFPSDLVRAIHEDARGVLWIGTENAGLVRLDPRGAGPEGARPLAAWPRTSIRAADGLFDDVIHHILPDAEPDTAGRLWMSTNRGLFHVAHADLEAFHRGEAKRVRSTSFAERDGLRSREANGGMQPAGGRDRAGRLWFPTQGGVAVVDPARLATNLLPPPVALETLTAPGATGDTTHVIAGGGALDLPAAARRVRIRYAGLSFVDPSKVRFRYRLDGLERGWTEAGTRREAAYTNLPPGQYTFRVQASNDDGVWNRTGAALALRVAPHWYETRAFAALCAALAVALGLGAVRWRTRRLTQQRARLQRAVAARTEEVRAANAQLAAQAADLRRADDAKSEFFANISHEFRTPLTVTMGVLEEWTEDAPPAPLPDLARDDLRQALLSNRRLLRLVDQLLSVARLESDSLTLHVQRIDPARFARYVAQAFAPLAERHRIAFARRVPEALPPVVADPDTLETILGNLLSNAFKFTPPGGRVELALACEGDALAVTVRDTGPGIPAAEHEAVFDRFHRSGRTQAHGGTGIGLALARGLARQHGGTLTVASTPGAGAAFTLRLPRGTAHLAGRADVAWREAPAWTPDTLAPGPAGAASEAAEDAGASEAAAPDETAASDADAGTDEAGGADDPRTTVLIVDDNADIRAYVRRHLEPAYRVLTAADGAEGLAQARTHTPDAVVSDVMMPRMDGLALLAALRDDPATDFIPVVLLTARAAPEDKLGGLDAGADDYLTKPFRPGELRARLRNLITQRLRLRERFRADAAAAAEDDAPPTASSPDASSSDASSSDALPLVARLEGLVRAHLADADFGVSELAEAAGMSRSKLYRDLKAAAAVSPADLIWRVRVAAGRALLDDGAGTISEVAYGVGFKSVSHFARRFRAQCGALPSDVAETQRDAEA